jgi:preprotein translocase subunit SecG
MTLLINILLGIYVFIALLMVLVILMQRPKSEGLGAAFGGGVTENLFGAQTTNVLTKITGWLAALFFLLTFGLSILYAHKGNTQSELRRELMKDLPPPVAASPTPGPTAAPGIMDASPTPNPSPSAAASTTPATSPTPNSTTPAASVTPVDVAAPPASTSATPAPAASPAEPSAAPATTHRRRHR